MCRCLDIGENNGSTCGKLYCPAETNDSVVDSLVDSIRFCCPKAGLYERSIEVS